jgi:CubicO group peptidase (beta-lactamase class C family)
MASTFRFLAAAILLALSAVAQTAPWPTSDWARASPGEAGMDAARLDQAARYVEEKCPTRLSLLVVRHGRLVYERYFHGGRASQPNNIMSMSKSMLSVLVGIALDEGLLRSVDQRLDEFFPEYFRVGDDARKHRIALEHLLTMTAGFEWTENSPQSSAVFATRDWLQSVIALPLRHTPGEAFTYNSGLSHLVSCILAKQSRMSTRDYANSRLFRPLGIRCTRWSRDPRGNFIGGWNVWMNARDLAKFGLLFLREGQWEGRTIVSREWIRRSSETRVHTGSAGWGFGDYGYFWWKRTMNAFDVTLASGYGGQNVFLIPALDLMVVTTARSDLDPPQDYYRHPFEIAGRYVIPAVVRPD